jgi:hypothetical protein
LCFLFNWAPHHEGVLGSGGIAPRILDLSTRWTWVVSFTTQPLYLQGKNPYYLLNRRCVGPRAGLDVVMRRKIPSPLPAFILILSSHLRLCLRVVSHSGFPTNILHAFLISPMHDTRPAHLILLDLITLWTSVEAYKLWSSSLCSLFQPPATSPLLGPNIPLSTLVTDTLTLCSFPGLRHQVSHSCRWICKL